MFPIALDLTRIPILLAGNGELVARRLAQLADAKALSVTVFADGKLPVEADLAAHTIILVTGLARPLAEKIAAQARALGKLVNVEDINDLCDFYFTANVTRGDLIIAVSTSGASPTLARRVRDVIANLFGEEWAGRTREIFEARKKWKTEGKTMQQVMENTDRMLAQNNWLPRKDEAA